jgi:ribosome-associated toxin RatA of RatAB toxin-antitoxin module
MKELRGSAEMTVAATPEACFALVEAVDRYPSWLGEEIREVDVLSADSDGKPSRVRTLLHVSVGPLVRDFDLAMDVNFEALKEVSLSRVRQKDSDTSRFDVVWHVGAGPPTSLAIELAATLDVPRLVPLGGVGDQMAQRFVEAANRELERSTPNASASNS